METFLNLIWLVIALTAIGVWRFRWWSNRRASRSFPGLVALICALALLFPSISLTDDLHPVIVAVDAASGKRNGSPQFGRASNGVHTAPKTAMHATAVLASSLPLISISASRLIVLDKNLLPVRVSPDHHGRSPPFSLA